MPKGILIPKEHSVNMINKNTSRTSNDFENLSMSDLLEIIKILLQYNIKRGKVDKF